MIPIGKSVWWNTSFNYRCNITIAGATTRANELFYYNSSTLGVNCPNIVSAVRNSIRVIDNGNNALPFNITGWNITSSTDFIGNDTLAFLWNTTASTVNISIYYNITGAFGVSASEENLIYDDFNDAVYAPFWAESNYGNENCGFLSTVNNGFDAVEKNNELNITGIGTAYNCLACSGSTAVACARGSGVYLTNINSALNFSYTYDSNYTGSFGGTGDRWSGIGTTIQSLDTGNNADFNAYTIQHTVTDSSSVYWKQININSNDGRITWMKAGFFGHVNYKESHNRVNFTATSMGFEYGNQSGTVKSNVSANSELDTATLWIGFNAMTRNIGDKAEALFDNFCFRYSYDYCNLYDTPSTNTIKSEEINAEPPAGDTCSCSSLQAGTKINCAENCDIGACNVGGVGITFTGTGTVVTSGDVTNIGRTIFSTLCTLVIGMGKRWG